MVDYRARYLVIIINHNTCISNLILEEDERNSGSSLDLKSGKNPLFQSGKYHGISCFWKMLIKYHKVHNLNKHHGEIPEYENALFIYNLLIN